MADEPLLHHLLKLSPAISEKAMAELLETLWSTRRSGLTAAQKVHLQTLLGFSTTQDLAPPLWLQRKPLDATNAALVIRPVVHSELSSLWSISCQNSCSKGAAIQDNAKPHTPTADITCSHHESGSANSSKVVPRLKSMTWTMDNRNSVPANQAALVSLMLQDHTKPSSRDIEVKFKISRDTLESVLRSMAHMSEQLSNILNQHSESESSLKKQKQ